MAIKEGNVLVWWHKDEGEGTRGWREDNLRVLSVLFGGLEETYLKVVRGECKATSELTLKNQRVKGRVEGRERRMFNGVKDYRKEELNPG